MDYLVALFIFFSGMAIGSFLNVVVDRLPHGKSLVGPPSHCEVCGRRLAWPDLVPLFSYLWLKGRCRYCHSPVPARVLFLEVCCGLFPVAVFWSYGLSLMFVFSIFWGYIFLVLAIIDLETKLVPDIIVFPGIIVALAAAPFLPHLGWKSAIIGAGIGFLVFLFPAWLSRGGMGWGDVKSAALLGAITGFPHVLVALASALISGGVVGTILLGTRRKNRKDPIPFIPFLTLGMLVTLFWGTALWRWWWNG